MTAIPLPELAPDVPVPSRPITDYLDELHEYGFTVLDNVIAPDALTAIREQTQAQIETLDPPPPPFDDRFGVPDGISWSEEICRAVTHPLALWIMRSYLETPDIHYCHQPVMTVLRPSRELVGTHPESGWHSDYPYHSDVYPDDRWQDERIYGVQYNLCIDEFRADNAATQYIPGSHKVRSFPPRELNEGGTRMGVAPHQDVQQMIAPAGSALIYDSRTWHRAAVELNVSGADRLAILNAVCPSWVRPMVNKEPGTRVYDASGMAEKLPETTRNELHRLCHTGLAPAPANAPVILEKAPQPQRIKI